MVHYQKLHILETGNNPTTATYFAPPDFQVNKALSVLLIDFDSQGCSYGCYDEVSREHQFVGYIDSEPALTNPGALLNSIEDTIPGRFNDYKHTIVTFSNTPYTLVPKALFDNKKLENYLNFSNQIEEDAEIQSNEIEALDSILVYSIPSKIKAILNDRLDSYTISHTTYGLLNVLLNQRIGKTDNHLFLFVAKSSVRIIVFGEQKLLLCNDYPISSNDDINYFSLAVCEQVGFNPLSIQLSIFNNGSENDALLTELKKYFTLILNGTPPKGYVYNAALNAVPAHKFFNVFSLPTCV